jgi:hypothetical protein
LEMRVIDDVEVLFQPPPPPTPTPPTPDGGEQMGDNGDASAGRGARSADKPREPRTTVDVPMGGLGAALRAIPRDELKGLLARGKLASISRLLKKASAHTAPPALNSAADDFPHLAVVSGCGQAIVGSVELIIPVEISRHLMKDVDPDGNEHAKCGCDVLVAWTNVALAEKGHASMSSALYVGYVAGDAGKPSPPDDRSVLHVTIFKVAGVRGAVGTATAHDLVGALRVPARMGSPPPTFVSFVFATYPHGFDVAKLFRSLGDGHRQHIMQQLLRLLRPMDFQVVDGCDVPPAPSGERGYFALLSWADPHRHTRAEEFIKSRLCRQGFSFDATSTAVSPLPPTLAERCALVRSLMTPECAQRLAWPSRRSFIVRVQKQVGATSREHLLSASSPAELLWLSGFRADADAEHGTDQDAGIKRLIFAAATWLDQHRRWIGRQSWPDTCWRVGWDYARERHVGIPILGADGRDAVSHVRTFRCGERRDVDCRVVTVDRSVFCVIAWEDGEPADGGVHLAEPLLSPVPPGALSEALPQDQRHERHILSPRNRMSARSWRCVLRDQSCQNQCAIRS